MRPITSEIKQIEGPAVASTAAVISLFGEEWACGTCGRKFQDCTSVVAHEEQCGGHLHVC